MLEVVTEAKLAASPTRVWAVLTDFKGYSQWHPWLTIKGVAAQGASINCSLAILWRERVCTIEAKIEDLHQRELLSWVFGFRGVFVMEERYSIEPIATGSSLRHSVKCRGLMTLLLGRGMTKKIDHLLRSADFALAGHLRKRRLQSATAAGHSSGKRHPKRRKRW